MTNEIDELCSYCKFFVEGYCNRNLYDANETFDACPDWEVFPEGIYTKWNPAYEGYVARKKEKRNEVWSGWLRNLMLVVAGYVLHALNI